MKKLITPNQLKKKLILSENILQNIKDWRKITSDIIHKKDKRLLVIIWPCSIHDSDEAIHYAKKLKKIKNKFPNLFLVMRTYLEKPRTTIWWKWFINDPNIDWTHDINKGLKKARKLLLKISDLWIPVSCEFLNPFTQNFFSDLITWWAIWARTTESQTHRELASNLDSIIWFKNWTTWDIQIAIDAIKSSNVSHTFLWINNDWKSEIIKSKWNKNCHIILRWWKAWPNYFKENILETSTVLKKEKIKTWIMIDVSHANSEKNPDNQPKVIENVSNQIQNWNKDIVWVMIESNIFWWSQIFTPGIDNVNNLKYWISITDWCISFDITEKVLKKLEKAVEKRKTTE
jgi:3-deoxy-7-phosphoheptulonate synthase